MVLDELIEREGVRGAFTVDETGRVEEESVPVGLGVEDVAVSLHYIVRLASGKQPARLEVDAGRGRVVYAERGDARFCVFGELGADLEGAVELGVSMLNGEQRTKVREIDAETRERVFEDATEKIRMLYGPAVARDAIGEALESVGATSHNCNSQKICEALRVLAEGRLRKILGDRAGEHVEKIIEEYDLE